VVGTQTWEYLNVLLIAQPNQSESMAERAERSNSLVPASSRTERIGKSWRTAPHP
jgi:hypothetical protein